MLREFCTETLRRAGFAVESVGSPVAGLEILLCLTLFAACAWHVRLRLRAATRRNPCVVTVKPRIQ